MEGAGGRFTSRLYGRDRVVTAEELPALRKRIADAGFYAYETTPDEIAAFSENPGLVEETFRKHMHLTLAQWISLAEERLYGTGIIGPQDLKLVHFVGNTGNAVRTAARLLRSGPMAQGRPRG